MKTVLTILFCLFYASSLNAIQDDPTEATTVRLDAVGDPLPERAIMRLGSKRLMHPGSVANIALSSDERVLYSMGGSHVIAWEVATGKMLWERANEHRYLSAASYGNRVFTVLPSGELLIADIRNTH